jgi:hypothetical protein
MSKKSDKISTADLSAFAPGESLKWDDVPGDESFGGGSNYIKIEIGSIAGPLFFKEMLPGVKLNADSQPIDLALFTDSEGKDVRGPAAAIFRKHLDEARLNPGDVIYIRRESDAVKKAGKGKGRPMEVYSLKVAHRA